MLWILRKNNVLIFGTFDHLHPGHRFVIGEARNRGDVTVVVALDANVKRIKGHWPVQSENERRAAIKAAFPDVTPIPGDPKNFLAPVRSVNPDLILLGYDQALPPGVTEKDLSCEVRRLPAYYPDKFKSSLGRRIR